jgi:hypothetical protein
MANSLTTTIPDSAPFAIKDCALIAIATGERAQNLKELRNQMQNVPASCIYHHFWGSLVHPRFVEPEYNNDFAAWASHALHDGVLAERLAVIDPVGAHSLESLRQEIIEVIEERLDESIVPTWTRTDQQFEFVRSQIVIFDSTRRVESPEQFVDILPQLSLTSVFYHFIDARRRHDDRLDDFRAWLNGFVEDYSDLVMALAEIDPYFSTLPQLRNRLATIFRRHFGAR